jgi:hypothetical protein
MYEAYKQELIVKPDLKINLDDNKKVMDHPLDVKPSSLWNRFFKDLELWEEIEKDVRRTRSDMSFFTEALDPSKNECKE